MAIEETQLASRRNVLLGGLAAAAGLAVSRLGTPGEVKAAANGNVQLSSGVGNTDNDAATETRVNVTGDGEVALSAIQAASGTGLYGYALTNGQGVRGIGGDTADGVNGQSTNGKGVVGTGSTGVHGIGGTIGVYGSTSGSPTAYALYTDGRIRFHGRSGHAAVTSGHTYKDVTIAGMTTGSDVIVTLRTYKSGFSVAAAVPYAGKFRLHLNKRATSTLYFSYLVIG